MDYEQMYEGADDRERVLTAVADFRDMLTLKCLIEPLKNAVGPGNYDRAFEYLAVIEKYTKRLNSVGPIMLPMLLWCPSCAERHVDVGEFATKPHHTHACQYCGMVWRPAICSTVGVQFLPGFKNEADK